MPKLKLDIQKINIYFYVLTAISTVAVISLMSLFLYKNFYQTITQSEVILDLRQKVATQTIDMDKFNEIIKNIEKKNKIKKLNKINNPFARGKQNNQKTSIKNEYRATPQIR